MLDSKTQEVVETCVSHFFSDEVITDDTTYKLEIERGISDYHYRKWDGTGTITITYNLNQSKS